MGQMYKQPERDLENNYDDGLKRFYVKCNKSDRERQTLYDIAYM